MYSQIYYRVSVDLHSTALPATVSNEVPSLAVVDSMQHLFITSAAWATSRLYAMHTRLLVILGTFKSHFHAPGKAVQDASAGWGEAALTVGTNYTTSRALFG